MLDYSVPNKDTGLNNQTSLQPINDGEDANQGTFRRPSENLRTRSEAIRKLLDHLVAGVQANSGLCVMSTPDAKLLLKNGKIRINVAGTDTASDRDLIIAPIVGTYNAGAPPGSAIRTKYYYRDGGGPEGKFQVVAKDTIYAYNGGNNLFIKIFKNARTLVAPVVTVEGVDGGGTYPADGPVTIAVEIDKDDVNTITAVVNALVDGASPALPYIDSVLTQVVANGANPVEERSLRRFSDDAGGMAAVDAECYHVTAAQIDNFFQAGGLNKTLVDGDTLVLNFGTSEARQACTYSTNISALLQIVAEDSRNLASGAVVPVCKFGSSRVSFINGKVFENNVADYLVDSNREMADLAGTGAAQGDIMIGAPAKSSTHLTLAAGTVRSQLTTLAGLGNQAPGGDTNIGAALKGRLAAGTVSSQIIDFLAAYEDHVGGSADRHLLSDTQIDYRPFVIVDGAGEGDYDTIADAITALLSTGGTVLVNPGNYTELINFAVVPSADIDVVGAGLMGDVVVTQGAGSLLNFPLASPTHRLRFANLKFISAGGSRMISAGVAPANRRAGLYFDSCWFVFNTTFGSTSIYTKFSATFTRCVFDGHAYNTTNLFEFGHVATDGTYPQFVVRDSLFSEFEQIAQLDLPSAGGVLGSFQFTGNKIYHCGNSIHGTLGCLLWAAGAGAGCALDVSNNTWLDEDSDTTDERSSLFCKLYGVGTISGNTLLRGVQKNPSSTLPNGMIEAYGVNLASTHIRTLTVSCNTIDCGKASGVVIGRAIAENNRIIDFNPTGTGAGYQGGVVAGAAYGVIRGNEIECNATGVYANAICTWNGSSGAAHTTISENTIVGAGSLSPVVSLRGSYTIFTGNHIDVTSAPTGVTVGGMVGVSVAMCVVSNNEIRGCISGIQLFGSGGDTNTYCTVSGNTILTKNSGEGVSLYNSMDCAITGNVLLGTGTTDTGIYLDATSDRNAVSGNRCSTYATKINDDGTNNGVGGALGSVPIMDYNNCV